VSRLRIAAAVLAAGTMLATLPARAAPPPPPEELPVPPIPPDQPPADLPAPVPDATLAAPVPPAGTGPSLRATLNERPPALPGGDPIPGTVYRYDQEQRHQFIPNPGIQLVVPLEK
jgi:hypothetical protein